MQLLKSRKFVLSASIAILVSVLAVSLLIFSKHKDEMFYGNTQQEYMSICTNSVRKSFPLSRQALYQSCDCSYGKMVNLMGKGRMNRFTDVLKHKDKDKTNVFLVKEGVNINLLDSYFMSCF